MKYLNPKIVEVISKEAGLSKKSVGPAITRKKQLYPSLTANAVAYLYAQEKGVNVLKYLDSEDKSGIPAIEKKPVEKIQIKKTVRKRVPVFKIIEYETTDPFIKGHIEEINRAYNNQCFTCVFILARKIIENLIIDIFAKYFPPNKKSNKELYFDINMSRHKDFSVILENLHKKRNDFGIKKQIVERLYNRAKPLKDNANDKTHSWYHLVRTKKEVDDLDVQTSIELIKKLLL
ncbi:MAG TPA: hypothetical protein PLQ20_01855 [Candidatus Paceibacterota bacterium]|nr:hypothetical protein [Candidatus Paceibacterota bacterium]